MAQKKDNSQKEVRVTTPFLDPENADVVYITIREGFEPIEMRIRCFYVREETPRAGKNIQVIRKRIE